jgi:hypothetical protein
MENETNHQSMQGAAVGIVLVSCDDRTSSRAFAPLVPLNFQNIRHTDSHERTTPVSVQYIRDRFTLQNIHDVKILQGKRIKNTIQVKRGVPVRAEVKSADLPPCADTSLLPVPGRSFLLSRDADTSIVSRISDAALSIPKPPLLFLIPPSRPGAGV